MNRRRFVTTSLVLGTSLALADTAKEPLFRAVACEGLYVKHLQGFCTDEHNAIFWCFTTTLVKTDADGRVLKQVPVASHHGDLCCKDGRVYVAVNLGKFNEPAGKADSWVYVYDADTLAELARHPVPELVHGAGGMAYHDGKFIIVGGKLERYLDDVFGFLIINVQDKDLDAVLHYLKTQNLFWEILAYTEDAGEQHD